MRQNRVHFSGKKSRYGRFIAAVLVAIMLGCGKPLPTLEDFSKQEWKNDQNGCGSYRMSVKESLAAQKNKLLSLTETDLVKLLGKADETELYKRSEKFYKYYFHGGPDCTKDSIPTSTLTVRFNAVGLAKEVVVE